MDRGVLIDKKKWRGEKMEEKIVNSYYPEKTPLPKNAWLIEKGAFSRTRYYEET